MRFIGARADDWRPDRSDVKPGLWIGGFIIAVLFYIALIGFVASLINGNGSPYLS
jgi:hypothetical protein